MRLMKKRIPSDTSALPPGDALRVRIQLRTLSRFLLMSTTPPPLLSVRGTNLPHHVWSCTTMETAIQGGGRRMVCSELLWIHFDRSDNRSFRNGHNQTSITGTRCFGPPLNFSLRLYAQLLHQKMVFHVSTFTKCMTRILTSSKLRTSAYIY